MNVLYVASLVLALTGASSAQTFNVDFDYGSLVPSIPSSTYGAAAGQAGVWNNIDVVQLGTFYVSPALLTTSGAPSIVVLEFDALGTSGLYPYTFSHPYAHGDDAALLDDCYFNQAPSSLTIRGLAPGDYRLYSYAMAPDYRLYSTWVGVAGSQDPLQVVGGDFQHGFAIGTTHAEHRITVTAGSDVVITFSVAGGFDSVNGLQIAPVVPIGTNYCMGNPNSTGSVATMSATSATSATGNASVAANDVVLRTSSMPANSFGYFLTSLTQGMTPNPGGSQGVLCIGGSIGRYVGLGQIQITGLSGAISLAIDLTHHPTPTGFVSVTPGQTWNFTSWFRDVVGGSATSNFADGLTISFI